MLFILTLLKKGVFFMIKPIIIVRNCSFNIESLILFSVPDLFVFSFLSFNFDQIFIHWRYLPGYLNIQAEAYF